MVNACLGACMPWMGHICLGGCMYALNGECMPYMMGTPVASSCAVCGSCITNWAYRRPDCKLAFIWGTANCPGAVTWFEL